MATLWQKQYTVDALIQEFTVGRDYQLDADLLVPDCLASIAHVRMLQRIGILTEQELQELEEALRQIIDLAQQGVFSIMPEDEDGHTAIEGYLAESLGDTGKKVHTGRSRNDQVQTAIRLWGRDMLHRIIGATLDLCERITAFAREHQDVPMPGRTHMQSAMPSSVGLWAASFAEELADFTEHLFSVLRLIDQCPLGAAASYGVPLPLDREYVSRQLGFARVHNNVLYANNSRGKFEAAAVDGADYIALTLSKIAQDLILFSLPEFGYFRLPDELCTGSSIMPQKKNPDGLELTRSKAGVISACSTAIKNIIRSLPSGYNRDFQDTKGPFMQAMDTVLIMIRVMDLTFEKLQVNEQALIRGFTPEIFATDQALMQTLQGISFRDAYKQAGMEPDSWKMKDPKEAVRERQSQGASGNLCLEQVSRAVEQMRADLEQRTARADAAFESLAGRSVGRGGD